MHDELIKTDVRYTSTSSIDIKNYQEAGYVSTYRARYSNFKKLRCRGMAGSTDSDYSEITIFHPHGEQAFKRSRTVEEQDFFFKKKEGG